jgi:4-amino-4-deoxychorismate lyase
MILVNGLPSETVAVIDRGLMYGDGVFRTLAVKQGRPLFLQRHLDKLDEDCIALKLPRIDRQVIVRDSGVVLRNVDDGVLKIVITRGIGNRGYGLPSPQTPTRIVMSAPPAKYPAKNFSHGIAVVICRTKLATPAPLAGAKSLNRLENVMARAEWDDPDIAEGLMCTVDGVVISGTMSNFFYVRDGVLGTSDLATCGVAGVQRARILDYARGRAIPVTMKSLHRDELTNADELFVCNSLFEIWPIVARGGQRWPVGPLTLQLQNELFRDGNDC